MLDKVTPKFADNLNQIHRPKLQKFYVIALKATRDGFGEYFLPIFDKGLEILRSFHERLEITQQRQRIDPCQSIIIEKCRKNVTKRLRVWSCKTEMIRPGCGGVG